MKRRWHVAVMVAVIVAVVVAVILAPAARVLANPLDPPVDPVALDYLQQGNRFYHLRDLPRAIDAYRAGSLRDDAPVFLFNLGQCQRQLGNYADSIWHFERFLARAHPSIELAARVDELIRAMRTQLALTPSGAREPWYLDAAGWTLFGAGLAVAATSTWLAVDAHRLDATAESDAQQSSRLDLRATATTRRELAVTAGLAGGGLVLAGIIKLALRDEPARSSTNPRPRTWSQRSIPTSWTLAFTGRGLAAEAAF